MTALLLIGGALGVGLVLMPTHVLSLLCGWALGVPAGVAVAVAGVSLGAPVGYGLGRVLAGPSLMDAVSNNAKATAACEAITRASHLRASWLVGLLRLSPFVPYGSTNVFAAAFAVPMLPFMVGTVFGLAPRIAAVVIIGAGLEQLDSPQQASPWLLYAGVAATLLVFVLMGWYAKRAIQRATRQEAETAGSPPGGGA